MASQAVKKHSTLPKFTEDVTSKTGPTPLSYSLTELSQIVVSNASRGSILPKLTDAQRQLITESYGEPDELYTPEVAKSKLTDFFDVFDDAFYFGSLKKHVNLDIRTKPTGEDTVLEKFEEANAFQCDYFHDDVERGERTPSQLCPSRLTSIDSGKKPRVVLMLFHPNTRLFPRQKQSGDKINGAHLRYWMSALVHEMLHAFFQLYSCSCWSQFW